VFLNQDIQFTWPNINSKSISECGTCLGLKNQIAILVNGDVVPCCLDENANIFLGNIFNQNLSEIIDSEKSKSIIEGFNNNKLYEKLCRTCGFRKRFDKEER
jgi:radical SAM protein with 4Fe4S-binding SPASM domain